VASAHNSASGQFVTDRKRITDTLASGKHMIVDRYSHRCAAVQCGGGASAGVVVSLTRLRAQPDPQWDCVLGCKAWHELQLV